MKTHPSVCETLHHSLRTLHLVWQSSPLLTLANAVFIVIRGFVPLLILWSVKLLVDTAVDQISAGAFSPEQTIKVLILVGVFYLLNPLTASLHTLIKTRHSFLLRERISQLVHDKTTTIDYSFFEDANHQNLFFRTISDSLSRPQQLFYGIIGVLQSTLTLSAIAVILFSIHWSIPLLILIIGVPMLVLRVRASERYYQLLNKQTPLERRAQYFNRVLTSKEFAKELRIFALRDHFVKAYRSAQQTLNSERERLLVRYSIQEMLTQIGITLLTVALFGAVVYLSATGSLSVGALAMYLMAMHRGYNLAVELLSSIAQIYEQNLFLRNFFDFIDMPVKTSSASLAFPTIRKSIDIQGVSFTYPNGKQSVLDNVNFSLRAGETVAIVGRNGCGKSTLVKLLCGLYAPSKGEILIDGVPLSQIRRDELPGNISAIFQDFMLYNAPVRDNIRFGDLKADNDNERMLQAAKNAGMHEVFSHLPKGYDTELGILTPESEMLSQGQWQRTALARSFFAESQLIVLDEPTSSLDIFTEAALIDSFRHITQGRTAVIVSHRMSTIRLADRIIVMADKHIAESGSYDELIARNGIFAQMVAELERNQRE